MTQPYNPEPKQPCPSCGHCPTCGRGGHATVWPYYPWPPSPWYVSDTQHVYTVWATPNTNDPSVDRFWTVSNASTTSGAEMTL